MTDRLEPWRLFSCLLLTTALVATAPLLAGPTDGETVLKLQDDEIRITWERLKIDSRDYTPLENLEPGETFSFDGGRAVKILTDSDLVFGGTEIASGNASPDYPGVYSLWLRRTEPGWSLVFNSDADIWGTQRLDDADVAAVALNHRRPDRETDTLTVELVEAGETAALLRFAWGHHEWSTSFEVRPR